MEGCRQWLLGAQQVEERENQMEQLWLGLRCAGAATGLGMSAVTLVPIAFPHSPLLMYLFPRMSTVIAHGIQFPRTWLWLTG